MAMLCVFCGSRTGHRPAYVHAARAIGEALADAGHGLVYGGGRVGLMGVVADAVLEGGGQVIGVIPHDMATREVAHTDVTELLRVDDMHQRKAAMYSRADAFAALPGGIGTLEELFETYTWAALGYHAKPLGLLDTDGYFGPLLAMLDRAVADGFLSAAHRRLVRAETTVTGLLGALLEPGAYRSEAAAD